MDANYNKPSRSISVLRSARNWWSDIAARDGIAAATRSLLGVLWDFLLDSTPARRRQRFGDAEYDWDHRVNTTSGAVNWRDRLLGIFHSPYQPTEAVLFHEMIGTLSQRAGIDFHEFTFVDLGSGKGRTLLMASDYAFRRIIGVELLPALNRIAQENLAQYRGKLQKCFAIESFCGDATNFALPLEPTVLFLFNPFPEPGLRRVISHLERSFAEHARPFFLLYHNPLLEQVLLQSAAFIKLSGTHQYSIFASRLRD